MTDQTRIRKLDEAVVNRIAAGEVIQRPAAALKELLENSIDAGATSITVVVKDGGFKTLQVQDNGSGIQAQDLPLLCERHATSKLSAYEDLQNLHTLGFRGEAMASISFVSHLTVTTMRRGLLVDPSPRPCAALPGTTILVEDLFYNVPTRKKVLKSTSEEYGRILDIVGRYAVHCTGCGFTVKRAGEARSDLHTQPQATTLDGIRAVHGNAISKVLQPLQCALGPEPSAVAATDIDTLSFRAVGWMSTGDHHGRKTTFVLFINGRPVDCGPLRRALEATYATVLPKAQKPWVYLALQLPPHHVDVNLHPTKSEVGFLHTDDIIAALQEHVQAQLAAADTQRTYMQTLLPGASVAVRAGPSPAAPPGATSSQRALGIHDRKLVRTDPRTQTLHAFAVPNECSQPAQTGNEEALESQEAAVGDTPLSVDGGTQGVAAHAALTQSTARRRGAARGGAAWMRAEQQRMSQQPPCDVASVQTLLADVQANTHPDLLTILRNHSLVGVVDLHHAVLQHGTRLYLVRYPPLLRDLFYQLVLLRAQRCQTMSVDPAAPVGELVSRGLDAGRQLGTWQGDDAAAGEAASLTTQLLQAKAGMLKELVGIGVDAQGRLCGMPLLLEQHAPDPARLPDFVLALGRDVDWGDEGACVDGLAQSLASLYAAPPLVCEAFPEVVLEESPGDELAEVLPSALLEEVPPSSSPGEGEQAVGAWRQWRWTVEHVLFAALRTFLRPPKERARDGSVVELTSTEQLYKVFERC